MYLNTIKITCICICIFNLQDHDQDHLNVQDLETINYYQTSTIQIQSTHAHDRMEPASLFSVDFTLMKSELSVS